MALIVSLIVLVQLIGGISCLVRQSPDSSVTTARDTVYAQMTWLEEQKFEGPNPPAPINVNLGNVESETTSIDLGQGTGGGGDGGGDSGGDGGGDSGGDSGGGGDGGGGDGGGSGGGGGG
jgi:hypothetical protein